MNRLRKRQKSSSHEHQNIFSREMLRALVGRREGERGSEVNGKSSRLDGFEILEDRVLLSASPGLLSSGDSETGQGGVALLGDSELFVPPTRAEVAGETAAAPPFPLSETFKLNSLPSSDYTIYLDFDGHITTGTLWNTDNGIPTITSPEYDTDATTGFSDAEKEEIQKIWLRVSEDFAPFDVNVTTEEPDIERLRNTGGTDTQWGVRAVFTDDDDDLCSCGGIAYIGSFDWDSDTPVWVYNKGEGPAASTASHEVGHSLDLSHDGVPGDTYYGGHNAPVGGWNTIMGGFPINTMNTWDNGTYFDTSNSGGGANFGNGAGDLEVIDNYLPFRTDDHGNTRTSATLLAGTVNGNIEQNTDIDYFYFRSTGAPVTININPQASGIANLDIWAGIYDSNGNLLLDDNPNTALNASFVDLSLPGGIYYLKIDGVGSHGTYNAATDAVEDPVPGPWTVASPNGYPDYASLGQYTVETDIAITNNDDFVNSNYLGIVNAASVTGGNFGFTGETNEPAQSGVITSAWWTWTAPTTGVLVADTNGSDFDTFLTMVTGTAVNNLTVIAQDNNGGSDGRDSRIRHSVTAGTDYHFAVDGFLGNAGAIQLNLTLTPNDDFANSISLGPATPATATGNNTGFTGEVGEPAQSGIIRSAWWSWTAPSSGTLVVDTNGSGFDTFLTMATGTAVDALTVIAQDNDGGADGLDSLISQSVTSGTVYHFAVDGNLAGTGAITLNLSLTPNDNFANSINLGSVTPVTTKGNNVGFTSETGEPAQSGGINSAWWSWTAVSDGTLVVDTNGSSFDTFLTMATGTAVNALTVIQRNNDGGSDGRDSLISQSVTSGTEYHFAVDGYLLNTGNIRLNINFTPSVFRGTSGDDIFVFDTSGANYVAKVNGAVYILIPSLFKAVKFDGMGGNDSITVWGGAASETSDLRKGSVSFSKKNFLMTAVSVEKITVNAGIGNDRANFYDATGNDTFTGRPTYSTLTGTGFNNRANGFDKVRAIATAGMDRAKLYDSPGNDSLTGRPAFTSLTGEGFDNRVSGFDRVDAYATAGDAGGRGDRASLYDSSGNEKFVSRPGVSVLSGNGFYNRATGFDKVNGYAEAGNAGGVGDRAYLYDSLFNDLFYGYKTYSYITGKGFKNAAHGFDKVYGIASGDIGGPRDRAYLYDSTRNDTFTGTPTESILSGRGFYNKVTSFDKVIAYASKDAGGKGDQANLYDSTGNDKFYGRPTYSYMTGRNFYNRAEGFDTVNAYARAGSSGRAGDQAYLYDSSGNDTFVGGPKVSSMTGPRYFNQVTSFDRVYAFASKDAGGRGDRADLYDSAGNDNFFGRDTYSYMTGTGFYNLADGFDKVIAHASKDAGGIGDRATVYDSPGNDTFFGRKDFGRLTGPRFLIFAEGFDRINAFARRGGTDTIDNRALSYRFVTFGNWERIV